MVLCSEAAAIETSVRPPTLCYRGVLLCFGLVWFAVPGSKLTSLIVSA